MKDQILTSEKEKLRKKLGMVIYAKRLDHGLTQDDVAIDMQISVKYYREMEKGLRMPTLEMLVKLSKTFDMKLSELCKEIENL